MINEVTLLKQMWNDKANAVSPKFIQLEPVWHNTSCYGWQQSNQLSLISTWSNQPAQISSAPVKHCSESVKPANMQVYGAGKTYDFPGVTVNKELANLS